MLGGAHIDCATKYTSDESLFVGRAHVSPATVSIGTISH